MPIIGTYRGASILAFPSKPGLRQVNMREHSTNATQTSPYTGSQQVQAWPGADSWSVDITLPQMSLGNAAVWSAFLSSCRGSLNVFPWGHPLYRHPQGRPGGSPVVNGSAVPMATTVQTRGWKPGVLGLLLPGDYIQLGSTPTLATATQAGLCRLHRVIDRVDSDASGNATVSIFPSIREGVNDGQALVLNSPVGLFRLATNDSSILATETKLSGVSLKIVEAR